MDVINIIQQVGIGPFRLGMSKEEVERTFRNLDHWRDDDGNSNNPSYIEILFMRENFEFDVNDRGPSEVHSTDESSLLLE